MILLNVLQKIMIVDDTTLGALLTNMLCRGIAQTMELQQGVDQCVCLHFSLQDGPVLGLGFFPV